MPTRLPLCESEFPLAGGFLTRGLLGLAGHAFTLRDLICCYLCSCCVVLGHFRPPASEARRWRSEWDGEEPETRGGAGPGASATLSMSMLSPESQGDHTVLGTAPVATASGGGETRSPPTGLSHVSSEDYPLDQPSPQPLGADR